MSSGEEVTFGDKIFEIFIRKKEIKQAIKEMARQINRDYKGESVVVLGVLDGVFMVLADLLKRLEPQISLELVKFKSYDGMKSTGNVSKLMGLNSDLSGKKVLIVEDIVDTGETLDELLKELEGHNVKSVDIASLLLKPKVFKDRFFIRYVGIEIPNSFVIGYGMDYNGEGRQLPHIYVVKE